MLDLAILLAFVVYALVSGLRARKQASENLEEYFLAGRTLPGWKAGTSMAATQFAADTPLLVTGLIATMGIYACWRLWIYGLAFLMMGFIFARMWRRAGVLTDAELTEVRYSGPGALWLRGAKAIYYGTIFNCVVLAMVLIATIRICEVFLPWHQWLGEDYLYPLVQLASFGGFNLTSLPNSDPTVPLVTAANMLSVVLLLTFVALYSTTGGLRAVVNTDVGQFVLMMVGTALYAWFVWQEGGWERIAEFGETTDPTNPNFLGTLYYDPSYLISFFPPYYFDPPHMSDVTFIEFVTYSSYGFLVLIGLQWFFQINSDGTGYLAQRAMACKSDSDAKCASVLFSWLQIFFRSILWLFIGVGLLFVYPEVIPSTATFDNSVAREMGQEAYRIAAREMTFVYGINDLLPVGVKGIMLTALLAALASTVDSHLNWGASYWSNDLYKRLYCEKLRQRTAGNRELVWVARLSNLLLIALALIVMANLNSIQETWTISLIFGAGVGFVLVARWLWERINLWSELGAIAASLLVAPILFYTVEEDWARLALMALVSTAAAVGGTFLGRTDASVLKSFYQQVQPVGWWRHTAHACGEAPAAPLRRFGGQALDTSLAALSLFGALFGVGKLLFHLPDESLWPAYLSLGVALAAAPFWLRALWK